MADRLGSARWATDQETLPLVYDQARRGADADLWIGYKSYNIREAGAKTATTQWKQLAAKTNQHALLCMGPRGGKGTSIIIPNLIAYQGSVVVIDPKGENATVAARRRGIGSAYAQGIGQKVYVLDPFEVAAVDDDMRAGFNPLDTIDVTSDEAIDAVGRIADAIVVMEDGEAHWNETARSLIQGLILHVLSWPDFEGARNLVSVFSLLTRGDWLAIEDVKAENEHRLETGEEQIKLPDPFEMLWEAMQDNEAFHGLVAGAGISIKATPDKERGSILSAARRHMDFIKSPKMQASLQRSSFQVRELKTDPKGVSIFLSLPTRYISTHYRWLRMLITLMLDEMERIAHQPKSGYPVLMVLDEFPGLRRMRRIEDATAQIPGYGVKLMFVVQSLVQLKEVYKENWETFLTSSGVRLFAANEDPFTLQYLTKRMGEYEHRTTTSSSSNSSSSGTSSNVAPDSWFPTQGSNSGSSYSSSTSEQLHKRALLTEDEIALRFSANREETLVLMSGHYPFPVARLSYFKLDIFNAGYDPHPDHPAPPTLMEHMTKAAEKATADARAQREQEARSIKAQADAKAAAVQAALRDRSNPAYIFLDAAISFVAAFIGPLSLPRGPYFFGESLNPYTPAFLLVPIFLVFAHHTKQHPFVLVLRFLAGIVGVFFGVWAAYRVI